LEDCARSFIDNPILERKTMETQKPDFADAVVNLVNAIPKPKRKPAPQEYNELTEQMQDIGPAPLMNAKEFRQIEDDRAAMKAQLELEELLTEFCNTIRKQAEAYTKTGALDLTGPLYRDRPVALAKVLLTAAIERHMNDFVPYDKAMQNDVKNLMVF
jgi:hypothetical protein